MPGEEVAMSREGERLIIEPLRARSLEAVLAELPELDEDIGPIDDRPPEPVEL